MGPLPHTGIRTNSSSTRTSTTTGSSGNASTTTTTTANVGDSGSTRGAGAPGASGDGRFTATPAATGTRRPSRPALPPIPTTASSSTPTSPPPPHATSSSLGTAGSAVGSTVIHDRAHGDENGTFVSNGVVATAGTVPLSTQNAHHEAKSVAPPPIAPPPPIAGYAVTTGLSGSLVQELATKVRSNVPPPISTGRGPAASSSSTTTTTTTTTTTISPPPPHTSSSGGAPSSRSRNFSASSKQRMGGPDIPVAETSPPINSSSSAPSGAPMGPRPLPKRAPSNPPTMAALAPVVTANSNATAKQGSLTSNVYGNPDISTQTSYLSFTGTDASQRTDIPSATIRDLQATLKDLAALPDTPPIPQLPPLEPQSNHMFNDFSFPPSTTTSSPPALVSSPPVMAGDESTTPTPASADSYPKQRGPSLSINTAVSPPSLANARDRPPVSPGMKHWQQVRQHILVPTPPEERAGGVLPTRPAHHSGGHKGLKYVTRAAERFGFRNAVENVMGHDRRGSRFGGYSFGNDLSSEEREEASRQRRRFARDIKVCLDACSIDESARRLNRIAPPKAQPDLIPNDMMPPKSAQPARPGAAPLKTGTKGWSFTHNQAQHNHGAPAPAPPQHQMEQSTTSTYAPLLMRLHLYLPDARAKRVWSRTCPHHAAILAELGVTFLQDGVSTDAERIQALEVFGTVVRNWATDSADEELDRWLWLCRAMLVDDKQLRQRGLTLLAQVLRGDPSLPESLIRPMTADDFESVAIGLLRLLHALETSPHPSVEQQDIVNGLLADLSQGGIIRVNAATVAEMSPSEIYEDTHIDTFERELLWMAAGRALAVDQGIASWLLFGDGMVLKRFNPAPIVPVTPPIISRLRVISATQFFSSLSSVVRRTSNLDLVSYVAECADYVYQDAHELTATKGSLVIGYVTVLLDMELKRSEGPLADNNDPFSDSMKRSGSAVAHMRLLQLLKESPKDVVDKIAEQLVTSYPTTQRLAAVKYFLDTDLVLLGRACVPYLLQRFTPISAENKNVKPFLTWLSGRHPQLFYKPLFTCSAATQISSLTAPLRTITTISKLLGPDRFWTQADPQMIVIVLMGGAGGAAKIDNGEVQVKPGRYAAMLELVMGLRTLDTSVPPKHNLKSFLTTIETRLAAMLQVEERQGQLPLSYRSLTCQLFSALRNASWWTKQTAATRLAVAWSSGGVIPHVSMLSPAQLDDDQMSPLRDLLSVEDKEIFLPRLAILDLPLIVSLSSLIVTIQASMLEEDWASILSQVWERYSLPEEPNLQLAFIIAKCAEQVPEVLNTLIMNDIFRSTDTTSPNRTLLKLSMLYGYRYQLLTQSTITDDRGVFKFSGKTFEFVATEIGSDQWVVPQDAQDQALKKYGQALPLELRQRLMGLGWSEEKEMSTADYERIPVTLIPLSEMNEKIEGDKPHDHNVPPPLASPITPTTQSLQRSLSNSSAANGPKTRRPILPPILLSILNEQTRLIYSSDDVAVSTRSYELIRMVEREDAGLLIRPINDNLPVDIKSVITRINADVSGVAPRFAYEAINSLAGYLKMSVRDHPQFNQWARILSTISRVVPYVSEMSLRDIRKSKAEPVLLPGSIYEDGSGFKLHQPWQNDNLPIQTAQLLLLIELLRANPRDVYLIKKLLFNLQVQASFTHLPFARAWLELVVQLFSGLNSNYNDRAEFRHFLNNISMVFALHGKTDIIVTGQAMLAISVCAARFRRVFASIGFGGIMRTVYECYVFGHDAVKDCIEYGLRSIYRIHRDVFVYQVCLALADDPFDPAAAYKLLESLSIPNGPAAGIPSGIRGLNEKHEMDALVQMLSGGAELSLKEIGSSAEERRAEKAATLNLGPVVFPRDNIIRLLVTVIAVNSASPRAIKLLKLFASLVPHMDDQKSKDLLPDGVDAIGRFIHREKMGDDQYMHRLLPGEETAPPDWTTASREYVMLVDAAVKNGCGLSTHATRRLLDIVLVLLQSNAGPISAVASSVLGSLTNVHLVGRNPADLLRDIAPTYRQSLATVDFSGVLGSITDLIHRSNYMLPTHATALIVHEYVAPVIRMLAFASEENMAFLIPVRNAAVELVAAAVFLPGSEALDVLESVSSSPGLLASVILPLVLLLDKPKEVNRDEAHRNFWIRILRTVLTPMNRAVRVVKSSDTPLALSSMSVLSLQVLKVIVLRAPECISSIPGLWTYLSIELLKTVSDGNGRFYHSVMEQPRVVDWMMWSLFELLVLHRTPLHIDCRLQIQTVLAKMASGDDDRAGSRPSSMASDHIPRMPTLNIGHTPSRSLSGLVRRPSARTRTISATSPTVTNASSDLATPIKGHGPRLDLSVQGLTPLGHKRSISATSPSIASPLRPSFADLSVRRASRPTFDVFPDSPRANRFPSSSPARALQVHGQAEKSAIVHLLGPATHLVSTTSAGVAVNVGLRDPRRSALRDVRVANRELATAARRAAATVMAVYGYSTEGEEPMLQVWSVSDALRHITEQTKVLVEDEFRDVFNPPQARNDALSSWTAANIAPAPSVEDKEASFYAADEDKEDKENKDKEDVEEGPSFAFTLQSAYDEPSFQTFKIERDGGAEEQIAVPTLSISQC